ncbi:RNase H family protein [Bradyrhizobium australiense]|nr:RNase H family protein [Bradyrhizobium australiense]
MSVCGRLPRVTYFPRIERFPDVAIPQHDALLDRALLEIERAACSLFSQSVLSNNEETSVKRVGSEIELEKGKLHIATIAGTDQRTVLPRTNVPAGYGWIIQWGRGGEITRQGSGPVDSKKSDHNEALVHAVRDLCSKLPKPSTILLQTTSMYIVDALRKDLWNWKSEGWKNSSKRTPAYVDVWMEIAESIEVKDLKLVPVHFTTEEAESMAEFQVARQLAETARDQQGRNIGAPLAGFGPTL